jgi:proline racemase
VRPTRMLSAIDVHAEGEAGRVLLNVFPQVKGRTMAERLEYCTENLDWLRRLVLREPRGYPALCANIIVPPASPEADIGLIVLEQGGFRPMSGSNTMCTITALLETQTLPATEPVTHVVLDTAVGLVNVRADVEEGKVKRVYVRNVPAFVVYQDREIDVPNLGRIKVDVAFGGQFFVLAAAKDAGVALEPSQARAIARAGTLIRAAAQQQLPVKHPENPGIDRITLVMLHGPSDTPGVSGRNAVVTETGAVDFDNPDTWTGALDRSPCGTGTCARMACLHARGQLPLGEEFVHAGILGTTFTGKLLGTTQVGPYTAVLPEVSGRAWITAITTFVLDSSDPFPEGYVVGDIWGDG